MKLTLKVTESRRLVSADNKSLCNNYLGTIGEKNATELAFALPVSLQGYAMSLVIVTVQGSFVYDLSDNTFALPSEVLTDNALDLQLILKDAGDVIWKSIPTTFYLNPSLDGSGESVFSELKKQWTAEAQRPLTILVNRLTEIFKNLNKKRSDK